MLDLKISKFLINSLFSILKEKKLYLHEPLFSGNEWKKVKKAIIKKNVAALGEEKNSLIKKIMQITNSKYVVLVCNGTSALYLALKLLDLKKNEEILVPNLNFISSTNAILALNCIPHIVDIDKKNLGIDAKKLENYLLKNTSIIKGKCINIKTKNRIRAIMPTYIFGNCYDVLNIKKICKKFSLELIEDAAEALGTYYNDKHAGTFGFAGIISFNGNKTITTGGGGALLLRKKKDYNQINYWINNGKKKSFLKYDYHCPSFNFEMPNLNACLGYAQILNIKNILNYKKKIHYQYKKLFKKNKNFTFFVPDEKKSKWNNWLQFLILNTSKKNLKNKIIKNGIKKNVFFRPAWNLLSNLDVKKFNYLKMDNLNNSKDIFEKIICLPSCSQKTYLEYLKKLK